LRLCVMLLWKEEGASRQGAKDAEEESSTAGTLFLA
jgi:hypothetical protein